MVVGRVALAAGVALVRARDDESVAHAEQRRRNRPRELHHRSPPHRRSADRRPTSCVAAASAAAEPTRSRRADPCAARTGDTRDLLAEPDFALTDGRGDWHAAHALGRSVRPRAAASACEQAAEQGLRCLIQRRGSLGELRRAQLADDRVARRRGRHRAPVVIASLDNTTPRKSSRTARRSTCRSQSSRITGTATTFCSGAPAIAPTKDLVPGATTSACSGCARRSRGSAARIRPPIAFDRCTTRPSRRRVREYQRERHAHGRRHRRRAHADRDDRRPQPSRHAVARGGALTMSFILDALRKSEHERQRSRDARDRAGAVRDAAPRGAPLGARADRRARGRGARARRRLVAEQRSTRAARREARRRAAAPSPASTLPPAPRRAAPVRGAERPRVRPPVARATAVAHRSAARQLAPRPRRHAPAARVRSPAPRATRGRQSLASAAARPSDPRRDEEPDVAERGRARRPKASALPPLRARAASPTSDATGRAIRVHQRHEVRRRRDARRRAPRSCRSSRTAPCCPISASGSCCAQ